MALLDELKRRIGIAKPQPPQDAQATLQTLYQAKTGKEAAAAPVASSVGQDVAKEQLATQQAQQQQQANLQTLGLEQAASAQASQLDQLRARLAAEKKLAEQQMAAKGAMARSALTGGEARASAQLAGQEENKINAVNAAYKNKLTDLATNRRLSVDDIFSQFQQSNQELELRKDNAQLEQLGFQAALANKSYLQEIDAIARQRGLENDLSFKKEYARLKSGEQMDSLIRQLGWKGIADADDRAFQEQLARMSVDQAISLANAQMAQSNKQAIASGIIKGAGVAATTDWKSPSAPSSELENTGGGANRMADERTTF